MHGHRLPATLREHEPRRCRPIVQPLALAPTAVQHDDVPRRRATVSHEIHGRHRLTYESPTTHHVRRRPPSRNEAREIETARDSQNMSEKCREKQRAQQRPTHRQAPHARHKKPSSPHHIECRRNVAAHPSNRLETNIVWEMSSYWPCRLKPATCTDPLAPLPS